MQAIRHGSVSDQGKFPDLITFRCTLKDEGHLKKPILALIPEGRHNPMNGLEQFYRQR